MLTHAGMKKDWCRGLRIAGVVLAVGVWMTAPARGEGEIPAAGDEPAWISQSGGADAVAAKHYGHAAFRSMGALLLMIGVLMGVHYWLKRRVPAGCPEGGLRLNVKARLRLGVRQELMVVEWEGDQIVLGVGPSFIQALHVRRGAVDRAQEGTAHGN